MRFHVLLVSLVALVAGPDSWSPAQGAGWAQPAGASARSLADQAFAREDWQAAADAYAQAHAAGMNDSLLHFRWGFSLHVTGRPAEALPHHMLAVQIGNPALRIDALYNVACANARLGNRGEALKFLALARDAGFVDVKQVGIDTDLDSLREDPEFRKLVSGIGKEPRLHEQMNFFLGAWDGADPQGTATGQLTLERPLAKSQGIVVMLVGPGGDEWAGLAVPNHADRTWSWTLADGIGTKLELIGKMIEGGAMQFTGRRLSPAGPGIHLRLTFSPEAGGTVRERVEISEDGTTWHEHHQEVFTKRVAPAGGEDPE